MDNPNTKVVVRNSVKQSPPATAAFCCKFISLLLVVMLQKMADAVIVLGKRLSLTVLGSD